MQAKLPWPEMGFSVSSSMFIGLYNQAAGMAGSQLAIREVIATTTMRWSSQKQINIRAPHTVRRGAQKHSEVQR